MGYLFHLEQITRDEKLALPRLPPQTIPVRLGPVRVVLPLDVVVGLAVVIGRC
jgi:hypothetical protein